MIICEPYRYINAENIWFCSIHRKLCITQDWKTCERIPQDLRTSMAQNIIEGMSIKDAIYQAVKK